MLALQVTYDFLLHLVLIKKKYMILRPKSKMASIKYIDGAEKNWKRDVAQGYKKRSKSSHP